MHPQIPDGTNVSLISSNYSLPYTASGSFLEHNFWKQVIKDGLNVVLNGSNYLWCLDLCLRTILYLSLHGARCTYWITWPWKFKMFSPLWTGLTFDGFNRFSNISDSVPNKGQILVYRQPEIKTCSFNEPSLKYNKKKNQHIYIKVRGNGMILIYLEQYNNIYQMQQQQTPTHNRDYYIVKSTGPTVGTTIKVSIVKSIQQLYIRYIL